MAEESRIEGKTKIKFMPGFNFIICESPDNSVTEGGVHIPEQAQKTYTQTKGLKVVAVGKGIEDYRIGDRILTDTTPVLDFEIGKRRYIGVQSFQVLGRFYG